jgi:hypothetical protein
MTATSPFDTDLDLSELRFDWVSPTVRDIDVRGAVTAIAMERTLEGASTVTVTLEDPDAALFSDAKIWAPKGKRTPTERDVTGATVRRPVLRGRAMEIRLDNIVFRLVQASKSGDQYTLTFEDRVIYWLRRKGGKARRVQWNEVTRAQFILSLLREIKAERVRFVCPELNLRQPQTRTTSKPVGSSRASGGGLSNTPLTVKGATATAEQRRLGEQCLDVANGKNAGPKATLALMEAVIVESQIRNLPGGTGSSVGILQLLDIHGSKQRRMDVEWCVGQFLTAGFTGRGGAIKLARSSGLTAGQVAQAVQGSAYPTRYDERRNEAQRWLDAYGGSGAGGNNPEADAASTSGGSSYGSYQYAREKDEDSWTCIQRLAGEVNWRCFMLGRALYYMSEEDLFRRQVAYKVTPDDPAIIDFDFDVDWGKTTSELQLRVVLARWKCPPGSIVQVSGYGPADGRWLVASWRRDYFNPIADVTLRQPSREKLEPAPQPESTSAGGTGTGLESDKASGVAGLDESTRVMRAYRRAEAIDRKAQPYKWGGGHGSFNDPGGYDCSGFVSSVLNAGGMMSGTGAPMTTQGLASWGEAGTGKYMTVYVKETGNPRMSHTFMVFNLKGTDRYAEAGGAESGRTGWHRPRSKAGFAPRHWPGI